jgi:hypothetical protein
MSHSTLMQRFEEFGAQERSILSIANMSKFEKQKSFCLSELGLARWNSGPGQCLNTNHAYARSTGAGALAPHHGSTGPALHQLVVADVWTRLRAIFLSFPYKRSPGQKFFSVTILFPPRCKMPPTS